VSLASVQFSFLRDARFNLPKPGASKRIGLATLRDAMAMQLQPPNMQLVVVGDLDSAQVEELALRYLAPLLPLPRHVQRRVRRTQPLAPLPFRMPGVRVASQSSRPAPWFTLRPSPSPSPAAGPSPGDGAGVPAVIAGDLVVVPDPEPRCVLMITVPTCGETPPRSGSPPTLAPSLPSARCRCTCLRVRVRVW